MNVTEVRKGFTVTINPNDNYGSRYGVFVKTLPVETTRGFCRTGAQYGNEMKPNINPAVEIKCTK